MIDLHCHLDLYPDPAAVIRECSASGAYVLAVTTTPRAWPGSKKLIAGSSRIRLALGLHPQLAHERAHELPVFDLAFNEAVYIGEIGMDGSPKYRMHLDVQRRVFKHIVELCALHGGRTMSIHSRGCASHVIQILKQAGKPGVPVFHWFSGSNRELNEAIDIGGWFSVGPGMLASARGRTLINMMPKARVISESDGPFAKVSGRPARPADMARVVEGISTLWGEAPEVTSDRMHASFRKLSTLSNGFVKR